MSNIWKCNNCKLINCITRLECQACFKLKPRNHRINRIALNGYFRENENSSKREIPQEIRLIVINYIEKRIIFAAGRNKYGQFGLQHQDNITKFERLYELEQLVNNINNIYVNDCALIIKSNDNIYAAGWNSHYQIGIVTHNISNQSVSSWTQIEDIKNVNIISKGICNSYQSFITTLDNKLYVNGKNEYGCFGDAESVNLFEIDTTKWLNEKDKIIDIQCGSKHTIFHTINMNIYAFGNNEEGQCIKDTEENNVSIPILVDQNIKMVGCGDWFTSLLTMEGIAKCVGDISNIIYLKNDKMIINIKCGARHGLFLDNDGNIYSIGNNCFGQRGFEKEKNKSISKNEGYLININEKIVDIVCGGDHSLVLSKNNNLFVFGYNGFKQCSTISNDESIFIPRLFNKTQELGYNYMIEKVICLHNETLIIIDPFA